MNDLKVTAIIPAFNENLTVANVVRACVSSNKFNEVIVVSDGSTDNTAEVARDAGATVFQIEKNIGKGAAMAYGVSKTNADIILFSDADLAGFNDAHIERLLAPVLSGQHAMVVGLRDRGKIFTWLSQFLPLIGGERAMLRKVFELAPTKQMQGYKVEIALNYYCRKSGLSIGKVFLPNLKIRRKYEKVGFWRGMWQYIKMFMQVSSAVISIRVGSQHIKK